MKLITIFFLLLSQSALSAEATRRCSSAAQNAAFRALDSINRIERAKEVYAKTKLKEDMKIAGVLEDNLRRVSDAIRCHWRDRNHCSKSDGAECRFLIVSSSKTAERYRTICTELNRLIDSAEEAADGEVDEEQDTKAVINNGLAEEFKVGGFAEVRKQLEDFARSSGPNARSSVTGETKKKVADGVSLASECQDS